MLEVSYYDRSSNIEEGSSGGGKGAADAQNSMEQTQNRVQRLIRQREEATMAERQFYWTLQQLARTRWPLVRAWRRYMDPDNYFCVSKERMGQYLRRMGFPFRLETVWRAMDTDRSANLDLEEFDLKASIILAEFR